MQRTISTWSDFKDAWDGVHNFLMAGECIPFAFDLPPLERIIEEVRRDPDARITPGRKGRNLDFSSVAEQFRALPIDQAMRSEFGLAHFKLENFYGAGQWLAGFREQVLLPWERALTAQGFTWDRCYPIVFISGPGSASNYHMDFSHVVAWQRYGTKRFCGLKDPDRWAPREMRVSYDPYQNASPMPEGIRPEDQICYTMDPGDVLWNAFLTPHWVEAGDDVAMSFNLSHGGIRLAGRLCPFEQEYVDWVATKPDLAATPVGRY